MLSLCSILALLFIGLGPVQGLILPCTGKTGICILEIIKPFHPPPLLSRLADCSSYQRVVVTPSPTTVTTTVATETITVTTTLGPALQRRGEIAARQTTSSPTSVPTYLGRPCTDPGIYGSACACLGIHKTTSTAPTPTVTTSVTTTTTTTVTVTPTCTPGSCGTYVVNNCGLGPFGNCVCGTDVNGDSFCFVDSNCSTICSTNAECGSGSRCLTNSCCGDNTCIPEAPGFCSNPANQLLNAADERADVTRCTASWCPDED